MTVSGRNGSPFASAGSSGLSLHRPSTRAPACSASRSGTARPGTTSKNRLPSFTGNRGDRQKLQSLTEILAQRLVRTGRVLLISLPSVGQGNRCFKGCESGDCDAVAASDRRDLLEVIGNTSPAILNASNDLVECEQSDANDIDHHRKCSFKDFMPEHEDREQHHISLRASFGQHRHQQEADRYVHSLLAQFINRSCMIRCSLLPDCHFASMPDSVGNRGCCWFILLPTLYRPHSSQLLL